MRVEEYDTNERFTAKVVSSERLTTEDSEAEVRELVLELSDDLDLEVGKSIGVLAPGQAEFGQKEHLRLYSVASLPEEGRVSIAVRRCSRMDDYSGERYPGVASNYLCDAKPGDTLNLTGPFGLPFEVPSDPEADLVLIATSTGIAPFRAFVRHLYEKHSDWKGRVWLFYGGRSGLDLAYLNDERDDFAQYYDKETFAAFKALSSRPHWTGNIDWDKAVAGRGAELWSMMESPKTFVYVAGLESVSSELDVVFEGLAGSAEAWKRRKAELTAGGRWVELLY